MKTKPIRIVVLVGGHGRGSNMQAIIDACRAGTVNGLVAGVISTSESSPALQRAVEQGVPAMVIPFTPDSPGAYDAALMRGLAAFTPDLIALAGYMKRLGESVVRTYHGRIMNIHPALIPCFCGKGMYGEKVHQAAIDYGVKVSGCTVHFVDEGYDSGPIIKQTVVPVEDGDDAQALAARVLVQEHLLYPECIQLFAERRLKLEGRRVRILPSGQE